MSENLAYEPAFKASDTSKEIDIVQIEIESQEIFDIVLTV